MLIWTTFENPKPHVFYPFVTFMEFIVERYIYTYIYMTIHTYIHMKEFNLVSAKYTNWFIPKYFLLDQDLFPKFEGQRMTNKTKIFLPSPHSH